MEHNNKEDRDFEIEVGELFRYLLSKIWIILIVAVVCGVAMYAYSSYCMVPMYKSTTKILALSTSGDGVSYADLQVGYQLTNDYPEIIKSRTVVEKVIEDANLNTTYEELAGRISVNQQTDTRILNISVVDKDPEMAKELVDRIRIRASEHINNLVEDDIVRMVDEGNLPDYPSSPSIKKNTLLGFVGGAAVCLVVFIVIFVLNDTISTPDHIEKYLGLSTLGMIPLEEGSDNSKGSKKAKKAKKQAKADGREVPAKKENGEN